MILMLQLNAASAREVRLDGQLIGVRVGVVRHRVAVMIALRVGSHVHVQKFAAPAGAGIVHAHEAVVNLAAAEREAAKLGDVQAISHLYGVPGRGGHRDGPERNQPVIVTADVAVVVFAAVPGGDAPAGETTRIRRRRSIL
jgi:hypothetical protein